MKPIDEAETIPPRIGVVTRSMTKSSTNASRGATTKVTAEHDKASVSSDEDDLEVAQQRPERKSSNTLGNLTNRKTKLDSERANRARELHCAAGHPSDRVLKQMLDNGKFKECSLTGHGIDNSIIAILGVCRWPICRNHQSSANLLEMMVNHFKLIFSLSRMGIRGRAHICL